MPTRYMPEESRLPPLDDHAVMPRFFLLRGLVQRIARGARHRHRDRPFRREARQRAARRVLPRVQQGVRRHDRRLRQGRRLFLRLSVDRAARLRRADRADGARCSRSCPRGSSRSRTRATSSSTPKLPDGASLGRTDAVVARLSEIAARRRASRTRSTCPGYSILLSTNISNVGGMFVILEPFERRARATPSSAADAIADQAPQSSSPACSKAASRVFGAPPVDGLGSTGGFKLQVQDQRGAGLDAPSRAPCRTSPSRATRTRGCKGCSAASASPSRSSSSRSTARRPSAEGLARRLEPHAPGVARLVLRQRLPLPEPQLAGQRAGRSANRAAGRGHRRLEVRNADGNRVPLRTLRERPQHRRPRRRQPLQPLPLGRDQRQHRAGRQLRPGRRRSWTSSPTITSRRRWATTGPS